MLWNLSSSTVKISNYVSSTPKADNMEIHVLQLPNIWNLNMNVSLKVTLVSLGNFKVTVSLVFQFFWSVNFAKKEWFQRITEGSSVFESLIIFPLDIRRKLIVHKRSAEDVLDV